MASLAHPFAEILPLAAITLAILATMGLNYLVLAYADVILGRIGPRGIDAATRIVGFAGCFGKLAAPLSLRWAWD